MRRTQSQAVSDTWKGLHPLLPTSLHKRKVGHGGGWIYRRQAPGEGKAGARCAFPGPAARTGWEPQGEEAGAASRGAAFSGGLHERRFTSHSVLGPVTKDDLDLVRGPFSLLLHTIPVAAVQQGLRETCHLAPWL